MPESKVIEIDFTDTIQEIISLKVATAELTEANKELKKVTEGNAEALEKYEGTIEDARLELEKNNSTIRLNKQEIKENQRAVDALTKSQTAQAGSIEANRAKLKVLTEQYLKLGKPTFEQTKRLNDLTNTLKRQESAIGNNTRNVGNYTASINESLKGIKLFGTDIGAISNLMASSGVTIKGATSSLGGFSKALISTGVGALVLALGYLIANFDKIQKSLSENREEVNKWTKVLAFVAPQIAIIIKGLQFFQDNLAEIQQVLAGLGKVAETVFNSIASAADAFFNLDPAGIKAAFSTLGEDVQKAFYEGQKEEIGRQQQAATDLLVKAEIETSKRRLNVMEAQGKDTYALRKKILEQELSLIKEKGEDFLNKQNELDVLIATKLTEQLSELRQKSAIELDAFLKEQIKGLNKAVETLGVDPIALPVAGQIDIPALEAQAKEVGTRLQNILRDEEGSSLFDALGVSDLDEQKINASLETASSLVSSLDSIAQVKFENDVARIEDKRLAEIKAVQDSVASEQDKAAQIEIINEKFNNQKLKQEQEFQRKQKGLQITQAIINGALAVTNALATVQPFIPLGVAAAALAATTTAVQIGTIAAQKFAEGGEVNVGGKPHSQGGTTYVGEDGNAFEVERGERIFVMKTTASQEMDRYSKWNQLFGGKSWTGKPTRYAAEGGSIDFAPSFDGGLSAREASANVGSNFRNMPPIEVAVSEINRVQGNVRQSAKVSEL